EMADMVVYKIANGIAQAEVFSRRMERYRITELFAFLPDRIVVVIAVESEDIKPTGITATDAHSFRGRDRTPYQAAQSNRLEAQRLAMLQFGDCLCRRVHRNYANRGTAVSIPGPSLGCVLVERMATRST